MLFNLIAYALAIPPVHSGCPGVDHTPKHINMVAFLDLRSEMAAHQPVLLEEYSRFMEAAEAKFTGAKFTWGLSDYSNDTCHHSRVELQADRRVVHDSMASAVFATDPGPVASPATKAFSLSARSSDFSTTEEPSLPTYNVFASVTNAPGTLYGVAFGEGRDEWDPSTECCPETAERLDSWKDTLVSHSVSPIIYIPGQDSGTLHGEAYHWWYSILDFLGEHSPLSPQVSAGRPNEMATNLLRMLEEVVCEPEAAAGYSDQDHHDGSEGPDEEAGHENPALTSLIVVTSAAGGIAAGVGALAIKITWRDRSSDDSSSLWTQSQEPEDADYDFECFMNNSSLEGSTEGDHFGDRLEFISLDSADIIH